MISEQGFFGSHETVVCFHVQVISELTFNPFLIYFTSNYLTQYGILNSVSLETTVFRFLDQKFKWEEDKTDESVHI